MPGFDPAKPALLALAKEFDARGAAMEAEAVAAAVIGFRDGIGDQAPPVEKAEDGDGAKASAEPKGPAAGGTAP